MTVSTSAIQYRMRRKILQMERKLFEKENSVYGAVPVFAMHTPVMMMTAPIIWGTEKGSFKKNTPEIMETTVAMPINEDARLTPIFAMAVLDKKKAITEQPMPWYKTAVRKDVLRNGRLERAESVPVAAASMNAPPANMIAPKASMT
mgnify:CR=1 FL=1